MWGIGWRKCCCKLEIMGRYVNQKAVNENKEEYDILMSCSERTGIILGKMFQNIANVAVGKNQTLMKENNITSFSDLDLRINISDYDVASNL